MCVPGVTEEGIRSLELLMPMSERMHACGGQRRVLGVSLHLVWDRVSCLPICTWDAGLGAYREFFHLLLCWRSTGLTDSRCHVQFSRGSRGSSTGPPMCMANIFIAEPALQFCLQFFALSLSALQSWFLCWAECWDPFVCFFINVNYYVRWTMGSRESPDCVCCLIFQDFRWEIKILLGSELRGYSDLNV